MDENSSVSIKSIGESVDNEESETSTTSEEVEYNHVLELPHGKELRSEETYSITASEKSKLIAVLGATGSGKTTLITAMYEQFLQENFPQKYCFSGSMTLDAFEQRAYNSRITCNRSVAEMERTPTGTYCFIMGLPSAGKTTFLAALSFSLQQNKTNTRLHWKKYTGNQQYLIRLAEKWLTAEPMERTTTSEQQSDLVVNLCDDDGNQLCISFPDLSGETFQSMYIGVPPSSSTMGDISIPVALI